MVCVCVLDYTYFTWYECPSRNFFHVAIFFTTSMGRVNANDQTARTSPRDSEG
jgi:hypothetical protein